MSLQKSMAVHAASERQYTPAGGEIQVPCGGMIHECRKADQEAWYADW